MKGGEVIDCAVWAADKLVGNLSEGPLDRPKITCFSPLWPDVDPGLPRELGSSVNPARRLSPAPIPGPLAIRVVHPQLEGHVRDVQTLGEPDGEPRAGLRRFLPRIAARLISRVPGANLTEVSR